MVGILLHGFLDRGMRWSSAVAADIPREELWAGVLARLRKRTILGFEEEVELRMDVAEARS